MNAIMTKYKSKPVLTIYYDRSDTAVSWTEIIEAGRRACGVSDRCIPIICIPERLKEVLSAGR